MEFKAQRRVIVSFVISHWENNMVSGVSFKSLAILLGCKESQFYSLPFRQALAGMYLPTSH